MMDVQGGLSIFDCSGKYEKQSGSISHHQYPQEGPFLPISFTYFYKNMRSNQGLFLTTNILKNLFLPIFLT